MHCRDNMTPREKFDLSLLPERPDLTFESQFWAEGLRWVAGIDEAGRGALAGPVAAGAVIFPSTIPDLEKKLDGVRDSKVLTPAEREKWTLVIKTHAAAWAVGFASSKEIDSIGIVPATCLAASRALSQLNLAAEHLLVDYLILPDVNISQMPLIKGDARSLTIASASILAKTTRDAQLVRMDEQYPGYHFSSNKGYATEAHRKAIYELGPCDQHRVTFSPVADYFSLFPPDS